MYIVVLLLLVNMNKVIKCYLKSLQVISFDGYWQNVLK